MDRHRMTQATLGRARTSRGAPPGPLSYGPGSPVGSPLQLLRIADICRLLRISKPTFWRMRKDPSFPSPTHMSRRLVGWNALEIECWLASRRHVSAHDRAQQYTP